jgi:hypothetical protein
MVEVNGELNNHRPSTIPFIHENPINLSRLNKAGCQLRGHVEQFSCQHHLRPDQVRAGL